MVGKLIALVTAIGAAIIPSSARACMVVTEQGLPIEARVVERLYDPNSNVYFYRTYISRLSNCAANGIVDIYDHDQRYHRGPPCAFIVIERGSFTVNANRPMVLDRGQYDAKTGKFINSQWSCRP